MIETFVSYDTAVLLKEKGFNEPTLAYYLSDKTIQAYVKLKDYNKAPGIKAAAPTHQMVIAWLRAKHKIYVNIDHLSPTVCIFSLTLISDTTGFPYRDTPCEEGECYFCYEEAIEAAVEYCLENIL